MSHSMPIHPKIFENVHQNFDFFFFTVSFHLIDLSPDFKFQVKISIFGRVMANSIFTDHIELVSDGDIK